MRSASLQDASLKLLDLHVASLCLAGAAPDFLVMLHSLLTAGRLTYDGGHHKGEHRLKLLLHHAAAG